MQPRSRLGAALLAAAALTAGGVAAAGASPNPSVQADAPEGGSAFATSTPIKHLVVIFGENVSFDHYFGTYPYAANPAGEPAFAAEPGTPTVNGLTDGTGPTGPLLVANSTKLPSIAASGADSNPVRLDSRQAMTCDQDHNYTDEQAAVDLGANDNTIVGTGRSKTLATCLSGLTLNGDPEPVPSFGKQNYAVMDYYDGNTVTGMWNYAQHFAMSDNAYTTNYGPSTGGALNVTSANTYGVLCGPTSVTVNAPTCGTNPSGYSMLPGSTTNAIDPLHSNLTTATVPGTPIATNLGAGPGSDVGDADPYYDVCSYLPASDGGDNGTPTKTMAMGGPNIGAALVAKGVTWGWFQGGFDNGYVPGTGSNPPSTSQICAQEHTNLGGSSVVDYSPHHEPFQYYASTANPMHLPPTSIAAVGHSDQANHQYDIADFWAAARRGGVPAVSFLKAPAYEDGHGGYSDPLDEQAFITSTINRLERLPSWRSTAVVLTYDDSDGWYDHVVAPLMTQSQTPFDALTGTGACGTNLRAVPTTISGQPEQGRCGLGVRIPFLVVSPYARPNFVDNTTIDQSSVVRFIEQNWGIPALGDGAVDTVAGSMLNMFDFQQPVAPRLFLDPSTGQPAGMG